MMPGSSSSTERSPATRTSTAKGSRLNGDGYVHPEFHGRGIGSEILRLTEERAREEEPNVPAGERVYLQNATIDRDEATDSFYRARGYTPVRGFRGMSIELETEPEVAPLPGIEIRPYRHPEEGRAFHAAQQEAFADHWEHRPTPWEEWQEKRYGRESFDPTLWWVAEADDGELAGVLFGEHRRDPDQGWVDVLGVRRAYRRRGIAEALLKTAFAEFFRRGERKVGLGVDAESPTGATRRLRACGDADALARDRLREGASWSFVSRRETMRRRSQSCWAPTRKRSTASVTSRRRRSWTGSRSRTSG